MKKIFEFHDKLPCYLEELDNGLKVYLIPNQKRSAASANIFVGLGGMDNGYYRDDKFIKVPTGIAHFLEHQLFKQEDGEDIFAFFDRNGASANANTSHTRTRYYFTSSMNFLKNLNKLLSYVNEPYFEVNSVKRESEIILEEYQMYMDSSSEKIFNHLMKNVFHNHPLKIDVIGKKNDIKKITADNLYNMYNYFYSPNNTIIILAGNFDAESSLELIKNIYQNQKPIEIKRPQFLEPESVVKTRAIIEGDNKVPKFMLFYKIPVVKKDLEFYKNLIALSIYNFGLFGKTSQFQAENKVKHLIKNEVFDTWLVDNQLLWYIEGESSQYMLAINKIKKLITTRTVSEETFERMKKIMIASYYPIVDKNAALVNNVYYYVSEYGTIFDPIAILNAMDYQEFLKRINTFNLNNSSYVVSKAKNKI